MGHLTLNKYVVHFKTIKKWSENTFS